jgi:mono/diheme cytochrome c family protein
MKRVFLFISLAFVPLAPALAQTAPSAPAPSAAPANGNGEAIFQEYCASCHGRGPGHPGTDALAALFFGPGKGALQDNKLSAGLVKTVVRNGMGPMPPLRPSEISDAELDELANYLAAGPHPAASTTAP